MSENLIPNAHFVDDLKSWHEVNPPAIRPLPSSNPDRPKGWHEVRDEYDAPVLIKRKWWQFWKSDEIVMRRHYVSAWVRYGDGTTDIHSPQMGVVG